MCPGGCDVTPLVSVSGAVVGQWDFLFMSPPWLWFASERREHRALTTSYSGDNFLSALHHMILRLKHQLHLNATHQLVLLARRQMKWSVHNWGDLSSETFLKEWWLPFGKCWMLRLKWKTLGFIHVIHQLPNTNQTRGNLIVLHTANHLLAKNNMLSSFILINDIKRFNKTTLICKHTQLKQDHRLCNKLKFDVSTLITWNCPESSNNRK